MVFNEIYISKGIIFKTTNSSINLKNIQIKSFLNKTNYIYVIRNSSFNKFKDAKIKASIADIKDGNLFAEGLHIENVET